MCKKLILSILMMLTLGLTCQAQEVVQNGNVFKAVKSDSVSNRQRETKTTYSYEDTKGVKYDIYLSASGKAFIKKISQKTGKEYRQYLPEIGRKINPKAYEEKK